MKRNGGLIHPTAWMNVETTRLERRQRIPLILRPEERILQKQKGNSWLPSVGVCGGVGGMRCDCSWGGGLFLSNGNVLKLIVGVPFKWVK